MNLNIHRIERIKTTLKQIKGDDEKPFFVRDIMIEGSGQEIEISLFSKDKANLEIK